KKPGWWIFTITRMKVTGSLNVRTRLTPSGARSLGSINTSWERALDQTNRRISVSGEARWASDAHPSSARVTADSDTRGCGRVGDHPGSHGGSNKIPRPLLGLRVIR